MYENNSYILWIIIVFFVPLHYEKNKYYKWNYQ